MSCKEFVVESGCSFANCRILQLIHATNPPTARNRNLQDPVLKFAICRTLYRRNDTRAVYKKARLGATLKHGAAVSRRTASSMNTLDMFCICLKVCSTRS